MRSWERVIPATDLEVHAAAGYGKPLGLGTHPAALLIDLNYRFLGRRPEPILRSVALCPKSRQHGEAPPQADDLAIVAEIAPAPGDLVLAKPGPSAFFGTALLAHLIQRGIDTLLVAGCTTSGCVRATVVDAASYGFRVSVVEECVFDRFEISHHVALFDLN